MDSMRSFAQPLAVDVFSFDREWMREVVRTATLSKDAEQLRSRLRMRMRMPPEQVLVQRVWMGELAMLSQLWRQHPVPR